MNVTEIMIKDLITINKNKNVGEAFKLMADNSIRHLPVIEKNVLVGIITDRDIGQGMQASKGPKLKVADVMTEDLITISSGAHVEDAARIFYDLKIGALPVVDNGKLLGIVTETDILGVFIEMMGILESSCRLDVLLDKTPKAYDSVSSIIKRNDANIISVGMAPSKQKNKRVCFFRLERCDMAPIVDSLKKAGYKIVSVLQ